MVDFLVIGYINSISYNNIHPLVINGKFSFGYNKVISYKGEISAQGEWFSNISDYCPPPFEFKKQHKEEDFRKFDNLHIINIDRIEDIPSDYQDIMGVPLSFLDKWNRDQFEIVGLLSDNKGDGIYIFNGSETYTDERHKKSKCGVIDGKRIYCRLLIKKK